MKKKWAMGLCFFLILMLFTACQSVENKKKQEGRYKIYYLNNAQTQVVSETYEMQATTTEEQIKEIETVLNTMTPRDLTYRKALPDNVVLKLELDIKQKQLKVYVDSNYNTLKGASEILCRAAIVKTVCQIPKVEYVEFIVDGKPLTNSQNVPIGFMTAETFIDNTGGETNYKQNALVTLFFSNASGTKLKETRVKITYNGTIPIEQMVIEQLIKGPEQITGVETNELFRCVSKDTKLIRVIAKDGICYVDFNSELLNKPMGITDEVLVYSIVNTLVELPKINKVQFTINGQQTAVFTDGMAFDIPFERNLDIIESGE